jgi:hypothetical protein
MRVNQSQSSFARVPVLAWTFQFAQVEQNQPAGEASPRPDNAGTFSNSLDASQTETPQILRIQL